MYHRRVKERVWPVRVTDARGKRHRGVASYGDRVPGAPPAPPHEFRIALLASAQDVTRVPEATAVCVPHLAKPGAVIDAAHADAALDLAALKQGTLPEAAHARYAAGSVLTPGGPIDAARIFAHRTQVDFERLALLLVEQVQGERIAPYTAVIRHELGLQPGTNALTALGTRLGPADMASRPPQRAPGIVRLRRALRALERGDAPELTIEQLTDDLRFLALFEDPGKALKRGALDRLLADVLAAEPPPPRRTPARPKPATIVPFRRREDA